MKNVLTTAEFKKWFVGIRDIKIRARIQQRIDRVEDGHFGDVKPVGEGVKEMRLFFGAGYRMYFTERRTDVVILLAGGDKSSQPRDIKKAIALSKTV